MIGVPAELAASHAEFFGDEGRRWIAALPQLADSCLRRWRLRIDGAVGWGAVALVVPVVRDDGSLAVLKLQPIDEGTAGEAAALRIWAGRGAVRLLEHDHATGSMLLQRLDAGRSLATVPDHLVAVRVIAGLLAELNSATAPPEMRRLVDVAGAMLADAPAAVGRAADPAERRLLDRCAARLREVAAGPIADRLLHWDLHYDNVLAATDGRSWLAIDPKPLAGDSGFELLPALWNRWDDAAATGDVATAVLRRFDLMTEVIGLDRETAAAWTLARVLQNAIWDLVRFGRRHMHPTHRRIAEVLLDARS